MHLNRRVRFFSTVDLVNALEQEKVSGRQGQIANRLLYADLVILTTNLSFSEWRRVFGDEKMTTALLDRLTHRSHILETDNESYRFKHSQEKHQCLPSPTASKT